MTDYRELSKDELVRLLGALLLNMTIVLRSWMLDGIGVGEPLKDGRYWFVNEWIHRLAGAIHDAAKLNQYELVAYINSLLDSATSIDERFAASETQGVGWAIDRAFDQLRLSRKDGH
jgi:hypothetical protein